MYAAGQAAAADIAVQVKANPVSSIRSCARGLRYTFERGDDADVLEKAVTAVLDKGIRTGDIMQADMQLVGTSGMGDAVLAALEELGA